MWWSILSLFFALCAVALSAFVCAFLYRAGNIHIELDKEFELPRLSEYDIFSKEYFNLLYWCTYLKRLEGKVDAAKSRSEWGFCLTGCAAFSAAVCKNIIPESVKSFLLYVLLLASIALFFALFLAANALIKRGYFHFGLPWYCFDYEEEANTTRQHRIPEPKDDLGLPLPLPEREKWLEKEEQRAFYKIDMRIKVMESQLQLYCKCLYLMIVPIAIAVAVIV